MHIPVLMCRGLIDHYCLELSVGTNGEKEVWWNNIDEHEKLMQMRRQG